MKVLSIGRLPPSDRPFENYDVSQLSNIARRLKLLEVIWGDEKATPSLKAIKGECEAVHTLRTVRNENDHLVLLNDSQIQERFTVLKEAVAQMQSEMGFIDTECTSSLNELSESAVKSAPAAHHDWDSVLKFSELLANDRHVTKCLNEQQSKLFSQLQFGRWLVEAPAGRCEPTKFGLQHRKFLLFFLRSIVIIDDFMSTRKLNWNCPTDCTFLFSAVS